MSPFRWIVKSYESADYITQQKAKSLTFITLLGIFLVFIYLAINVSFQTYKIDPISQLYLPLVFLAVLIVSVILIKAQRLTFAGNFLITSLILSELATNLINISDPNKPITLIYCGNLYYVLMLLTLGALYLTHTFLTINTLIILAVLATNLFIAKDIHDPQKFEQIRISTVDFALNVIVVYVFLYFLKKIVRIALDQLRNEREEKQKQNETLQKIIDSMKLSIQDLKQTSEQLLEYFNNLSQRSKEQAATTEEIAASIEEMSSSIESTSNLAQQTHSISQKAAAELENAQAVLNTTIDTFLKISENVSNISEIATKTDLLAINAAIEAARLQEQSGGFTVIANEIRKLADTTKNTSAAISKISAQAQQQAIQTKNKFKQIVDDINKIFSHMEHIAIASEEQLKTIQQINQAVVELSKFSEQNAEIADKLVITSQKLNQTAQKLEQFLK